MTRFKVFSAILMVGVILYLASYIHYSQSRCNDGQAEDIAW